MAYQYESNQEIYESLESAANELSLFADLLEASNYLEEAADLRVISEGVGLRYKFLQAYTAFYQSPEEGQKVAEAIVASEIIQILLDRYGPSGPADYGKQYVQGLNSKLLDVGMDPLSAFGDLLNKKRGRACVIALFHA